MSHETIDRVSAAREVLDNFLAKRKGDRVGVVVFGSAPFVLVPFTTDLVLVRRMMAEMQAGMAGPRTASGDAIGLGINLLANSPMKHKTMIALTDGNDTASQVPPAEAGGIAHDRGITIYTVAIGDPAAVGEDKLDEVALRDVAGATGGAFFRTMDRVGLAEIYRRLDAIETREVDTISARPRTRPVLVAARGDAAAVLVRAGDAAVAACALSRTAGNVVTAIASFHFLRPLWLIALLPAVALWWAFRRQAGAPPSTRICCAISSLPG